MTKKPLVCALLCIAVLTFAGVVALGSASQESIITINGGRTTVAPQGPVGTPRLWTHPFAPDAVKVYSNLGTGGSVYDCCSGYTVSGKTSPVGENIISANAFLSGDNYTVVGIEVAVGYVIGTNSVVVSLNEDNGGIPGKVLHRWTVTNLPTFGTCCTLAVIRGSRALQITKGTQYWVVARPAVSDTWDAWNLNSTGATGLLAQKINGTWSQFSGATLSAFAVFGKVVN
jgi:hypothetical protein